MLTKKIIKRIREKSPKKKDIISFTSKKTKLKTPLAYVYVYYKLRQLLKNRHTITFLQTSEVLNALQMTIKIPKRMKYLVLAEMEDYGLIKRINHQRYWISNKPGAMKELKRINDCMKGYPFW